jgi:hypothetical protein
VTSATMIRLAALIVFFAGTANARTIQPPAPREPRPTVLHLSATATGKVAPDELVAIDRDRQRADRGRGTAPCQRTYDPSKRYRRLGCRRCGRSFAITRSTTSTRSRRTGWHSRSSSSGAGSAAVLTLVGSCSRGHALGDSGWQASRRDPRKSPASRHDCRPQNAVAGSGRGGTRTAPGGRRDRRSISAAPFVRHGARPRSRCRRPSPRPTRGRDRHRHRERNGPVRPPVMAEARLLPALNASRTAISRPMSPPPSAAAGGSRPSFATSLHCGTAPGD